MLQGNSLAETRATEQPIEHERLYRWGVDSETGRLSDVLLSTPAHLAMVPCNAVTRDSLARGLSSCPASAGAQHRPCSGSKPPGPGAISYRRSRAWPISPSPATAC